MHKLKNLKHIFAIWTIVLGLTFGVYLYGDDDTSHDNLIQRTTQYFIYQQGFFRDLIYTHTQTKGNDVLVLPIDTNMMNELQAANQSNASDGSFRITKTWYKDVIELLEDVGVKAIGIDIVFQNRDEYEKDFADVMGKYDNIVLATMKDNPGNSGNCHKDSSSIGDVIGCENTPRSVYNKSTWAFIDTNSYMTYPDMDTPDYYSTSLGYTGGTIDSFALALYKKYTGKTGSDISDFLHLRSDGSYLNTYFGTGGAYFIPDEFRKTGKRSINLKTGEQQIGAVGILAFKNYKALLREYFEGKIVLIGEDGTIFHDTVRSPYTGKDIAGVELHANMLDGMLQNKLLSEFSGKSYNTILILVGALFIVLYFFLPNYISPILCFLSVVAALYIGRYLYDIQRIVIPFLPVLLILASSFIVTFIYRFFIVDKEKRKLKKDFGHYVDPRVVAEISESGHDIELGGERRPMTVMFSDIAGFTTISEKLTPNDLFFLMTSYLSNMTDILIEQGGTLDKYIGDAVMGFFGAPLSVSDHALRACRTALLMRERLPEFNTEITKHGIEAIDFRVGIATGDDVMVGNIGSKDRFNYTVLGDTVNLASRLEGTGKEYGVHIIIAHPTREAIGDAYIVRELDTIAVKGKTEGVRIYELIGTRDQATNLYAYEVYEKALALYRAGQYRDAGIMWEKQKDIDSPSRIMMERCLELIKNGTTLENGVYHMTHK